VDAYQTLVIILATTLAIFLILSIVVASLLIALLRTGQRIATRLETTSEKATTTANDWIDKLGPAIFASTIMSMFRKRRR
jgi:hypothetical protein